MKKNISYVRKKYIPEIINAFDESNFVAVSGASGLGKLDTAKEAARNMNWGKIVIANGNKYSQGYFGGFHELFDEIFSDCSKNYPEIISGDEQAIKRFFPRLESPHFKVPKDLTNTSDIEERTRFYHHEYQNKILHELFDFFSDYLREEGQKVTLIIDRADALSRTAESFLAIILRKDWWIKEKLRIIALFDKPSRMFMEFEHRVQFEPMTSAEGVVHVKNKFFDITDYEAGSLCLCSEGNVALLDRLLDCHDAGLRMYDYLDAKTLLDFLISTFDKPKKNKILIDYIKEHCVADDPLILRLYETALTNAKDAAHRMYHLDSFEAYKRGEDRLRIIHGLSVSDPIEQLDLLCDPSVELKAIGLYDTWFEFFSKYFTNEMMRKHGTGEDTWNSAFVNVAFILYALGLAKISIPYLELFYKHFPNSKLTPTVLYAQSMTYGRYQVPVDLEKANAFAELNLQLIDSKFKDHEKYKYIKVFAENALAYIRARQGNFQEALRLCTFGLEQMETVYGDKRFKLHQSILIYNTGQIYELLKDYANAEKYYKMAIALDPYYAEYYNDMGNLLAKMEGRDDEIYQLYQKAVDLSPSYHEVHINCAEYHEKRGEIEDAIFEYQWALDIKPNEYRAYFNFGNMYLRQGEYSDAAAQYEAALYYQNQDPEIYNNLGLAYSELKMRDNAIEAFKRAIKLKPSYGDAHNNLAIELFEADFLDGARYHANRAVECDPSPSFQQTLKAIEEKKKLVTC